MISDERGVKSQVNNKRDIESQETSVESLNNPARGIDDVNTVYRNFIYSEPEKADYYLDNRDFGAHFKRVDFYRYFSPSGTLCRRFFRGWEMNFRPSIEKGGANREKIYSLDQGTYRDYSLNQGIYSDHGFGDDNQPQRWISAELAAIDIQRLIKRDQDKATGATDMTDGTKHLSPSAPFYNGCGKFEIVSVTCHETWEKEEKCWRPERRESTVMMKVTYFINSQKYLKLDKVDA